jgi:chromosome segregation ATPase
MGTPDIKALIKQATRSFDALSRELYCVAAIQQQIDQQKAAFAELRGQCDGLRQELEALTAQLAAAKAELASARDERAQIEKGIAKLNSEHGALMRDIERVKQKLVEEAA